MRQERKKNDLTVVLNPEHHLSDWKNFYKSHLPCNFESVSCMRWTSTQDIKKIKIKTHQMLLLLAKCKSLQEKAKWIFEFWNVYLKSLLPIVTLKFVLKLAVSHGEIFIFLKEHKSFQKSTRKVLGFCWSQYEDVLYKLGDYFYLKYTNSGFID